MSINRIDRINELLRREIAEALFKVMTENGFDLSAVTVTHVVASRNLRHARVLVSIRDHADERPRMLNMVRGHRTEIQAMINRDLVLKYTPRLAFELDGSIEQGDHVLGIIAEIEKELGPLETDAPDADEEPDAPEDF